MSTGSSIHSSEYPHRPHTYRDNPTQPAMVKAIGMMLLLVFSDEADTTKISHEPHFGHDLPFFMGLDSSTNDCDAQRRTIRFATPQDSIRRLIQRLVS
jgi:hypothetical protein